VAKAKSPYRRDMGLGWSGAVCAQKNQRTLVTTKAMDKKPKVKYSFSNGNIDGFAPKEYAIFQTQQYWIERTFDDAKNELGMSDYQIRKWTGWHHHISGNAGQSILAKGKNE
jgi:SRSO17 transposase